MLLIQFELVHCVGRIRLRLVALRALGRLDAIRNLGSVFLQSDVHGLCPRRLLDRRSPRTGNGADPFASKLAILGTESHAGDSVTVTLDILPHERAGREVLVAILPLDDALPRRVGDAELAKLVVEVAAVLFGNVPAVDEALEGGQDLGLGEDENLGDGNGVEPALDPAPDGAEEEGGANDEDAVEGLWVVGGGELGGGLHVALEVPKLLEADARDVDNVGAEGNGHVRALAVGELRGKRLAEARQVLVQRKQAQQAGGRLAVRLGLGKGRVGALLLVVGYGFRVERANLKHVERDAAAVAAACPLRILYEVSVESRFPACPGYPAWLWAVIPGGGSVRRPRRRWCRTAWRCRWRRASPRCP